MELILNKPTLRVFYGSDFHADFWKSNIQPFTSRVDINKFDLFLLAGDVSEWEDWGGNCLNLYDQILSAGKPIIMIPGNHEFYGGNYQKVMREMAEYAQIHDNFYFLERNYVDLPVQELRIWGDTLWTDFRGDETARAIAQRYMNDYRQITYERTKGHIFLEPEDTIILNDKARTSLRQTFRDTPKGWQFLAMTHHAPFPQSTPKQYRKPEYTDTAKLNKAYSNDMWGWCYENEVTPNVWIHGHIHDRALYDVDFDGPVCTVVSNPFGYPGEKDHDQISRHWLEVSKNKILVV